MCLNLEPYGVQRLEQLCHFTSRLVLVITWFTLHPLFSSFITQSLILKHPDFLKEIKNLEDHLCIDNYGCCIHVMHTFSFVLMSALILFYIATRIIQISNFISIRNSLGFIKRFEKLERNKKYGSHFSGQI
jgi:hypothetical protein